MEVRNLSQMKRLLKKGAKFRVVNHNIHPNYTGQERIVNVVQTNGIYSQVLTGDNKEIYNAFNEGKGIWMTFGKATEWKIENNLCTAIVNGEEGFTIEIL